MERNGAQGSKDLDPMVVSNLDISPKVGLGLCLNAQAGYVGGPIETKALGSRKGGNTGLMPRCETTVRWKHLHSSHRCWRAGPLILLTLLSS